MLSDGELAALTAGGESERFELAERRRWQDLPFDQRSAAPASLDDLDLSGSIEKRLPDYPIVALQQLLVNGVMHRTYESSNAPTRLYWYEDCVEIVSPGDLHGTVTPENFGQPGVTDYRNPLIAEALRVLGAVQRFGYGIQLARSELQANGNPPPEFEFGAFVQARVRAAA